MIFASVAQWPALAVQCSPARPDQPRPRQQRRREHGDIRHSDLTPGHQDCVMCVWWQYSSAHVCWCLGPESPDVCDHWWWHGRVAQAACPPLLGAGVYRAQSTLESRAERVHQWPATTLSFLLQQQTTAAGWCDNNTTAPASRWGQTLSSITDQDVVRHKNSCSNIPQLISRHIAHPTFLILRSLAATVARAAGIFKRLRLGLNTHYTEMFFIRTVFKVSKN